MNSQKPQLDPVAVASLITALVGVLAWSLLRGLAALLAATLSLVLGFLALFRMKRSGRTGRWLAVAGIGFGVVFYAFLIVTIVRDIIDPVQSR